MPDSAATEIEEGEAALSQRRIWITDTSGEANPQPATNDPAFRDERPEWSVDGRKILFARIDGEGQASLWLLSLATGETELVVERISLPNQTDPALQNVLWNGSYDWLP